MAQCVRLLRTLCPKLSSLNRSSCLTVPAVEAHYRRSTLENRKNRFCSSAVKLKKETVVMYFLDRDGDRLEVSACVGDNLLDVAIKNDVELEGACEGTLACSTCHLIFKPENYSQLPAPTDEENDMLDLAFDLQDTSRLGCQVTVTKEMAGWEVKVPSGVSDARDL
ncbi:2Fe-2S ferredoxin-like isoform X2 [Babylonia areolata]|uniref:2Fe-2S ferredoxin-like isoform X2 n=1 Tax=Babylonia areolata TaxID=304850 RepID=UPI003FD53DC4